MLKLKPLFAIDNILVSPSLFLRKFLCDLQACKGACCVEGESGAPLTQQEIELLENDLPKILPHLTENGAKTILEQGVFVRKSPGLKTPLMEGGACAFTIWENGIAQCGIEKAFHAGDTPFQKPISCHLYPIRVRKEQGMDWLEYESWDICKAACSLGKKQKLPLYQFLKTAIIREYGNDFYEALQAIDEQYQKSESQL